MPCPMLSRVNKANRLLGIIRKFFKRNYRYISLYKAIVRAVLEYGNLVWGPTTRPICKNLRIFNGRLLEWLNVWIMQRD